MRTVLITLTTFLILTVTSFSQTITFNPGYEILKYPIIGTSHDVSFEFYDDMTDHLFSASYRLEGPAGVHRDLAIQIRPDRSSTHYTIVRYVGEIGSEENEFPVVRSYGWHSVRMILNSFGYEIYLDDSLISVNTFTFEPDNFVFRSGIGESVSSEVGGPYEDGINMIRFLNINGTSIFGLVSHWPLDEESGTFVEDVSDNTNDGNSFGTTIVETCINNGRRISSDNDYILVPDNFTIDFVKDFTIAAWVVLEQNTDDGKIIIKSEALGIHRLYELNIGGDSERKLGFQLGDPDTDKIFSSDSIPLNECVFLVGLRENDSMKIYINGQFAGSKQCTTEDQSNAGDVYIGKHPYIAGQYFPGIIADVKLFNYALSPEEILNEYQNGIAGLSIPPITAQPCDDECVKVPVTVDIGTAIQGFQVPLDYSAGEVCSVSTVGLLTEDWYTVYQTIDNDNHYISVSMTDTSDNGDGYLPTGEHTLFNIYFKPLRECQLDYYITFDTLFSDDQFKKLAFSDTLFNTVIPDFQTDSMLVIGFLPGDFNDDGSVDISDLLGFVDFAFLPSGQGESPCLMDAIELTGDCQVDISDILRMVDYMFVAGADPLTCGCHVQTVSSKFNPNFEFKTIIENGQTKIIFDNPDEMLGMELYLKGDMNSINTSLEGFELFHRTENGLYKVGLLDMEGIEHIKAGNQEILTIDGQVELIEAVVTDMDFNSIYMTNNSVNNLPTEYSLSQNYPNPFNPSTEIAFSLPNASEVKLDIFNIKGQLVKTVVNGKYDAGSYTVEWDSRDERGNQVSSGIYLYRLTAGEFTETRKMILLK